MGCAGSTNALPTDDKNRPLEKKNGINSNKPPSVAFVIPLNDQEGPLIKKHPPKRFQRLEEQQISPPVLTHKILQDKLAEAEQRRLQILNERIESAKILMRPKCANGNTKATDDVVSRASTPRLIEASAS